MISKLRFLSITPILLIFWILAYSPNFIQKIIGYLLGQLFYYGLPSRRKVAYSNISIAFPQLSTKEKENLTKQNFLVFGYSLVEMSMAWFLPIEKLQNKVIIKGKKYLLDAKKNNQGVIIIPPHYCNLETIATLISVKTPIYISYYIQAKSAFYQFFKERRRTLAEDTIDTKNLRSMVKVLQQKGVLWYSPDQSKYEKNAPYVQFFSKQVKTTAGTVRLAKSGNAQIIPLSAHYDEAQNKYIIELHKPLMLDANNNADNTRVVNQALEKIIKQNPKNYLWLHKRFKDVREEK